MAFALQGYSSPGAQAYAVARERRRPVLHALVLALIAVGLFSALFVPKTFPFQLERTAPITGLTLPGTGVTMREEPLTASVLPDTVRRQELEEAFAATLTEPAFEVEPAVAAAEVVAPPPTPFTIYTIQTGDTAGAVAARFDITLQYLLWNNGELRDEDFLAIGGQLFIPVGNGILHYVSLGESLGGIASFYNVALDDILAWEGNGITAPDQILEGVLIFVPGGVPPAPVVADPPVAVVSPPVAEPPPAATGPVTIGPISISGLSWPFNTLVSSPFGPRGGGFHSGIDIQGHGRTTDNIAASTSGTVTLATNCCGRGNYVMVVNDAGTVRTLYAHLSRIDVAMGQHVSQGQTLGLIGSTGISTGTHLHFEVHVIINGVWTPVNPLNYLPGR